MDGGFYHSPLRSESSQGAALVVLYAEDLEATLERITAAGGELCKPIFSFPGGRRFHSLDPNRNELAVWSDRQEAAFPMTRENATIGSGV